MRKILCDQIKFDGFLREAAALQNGCLKQDKVGGFYFSSPILNLFRAKVDAENLARGKKGEGFEKTPRVIINLALVLPAKIDLIFTGSGGRMPFCQKEEPITIINKYYFEKIQIRVAQIWLREEIDKYNKSIKLGEINKFSKPVICPRKYLHGAGVTSDLNFADLKRILYHSFPMEIVPTVWDEKNYAFLYEEYDKKVTLKIHVIEPSLD